jgi:hypothetical protein
MNAPSFLRSGLRLGGYFLLLVATAVHAFEHWEISTQSDCISHSETTAIPDDIAGESGSRHDHGCGSHDHSVAVLNQPIILNIHPPIHAHSDGFLTDLRSSSDEIDLPPRVA